MVVAVWEDIGCLTGIAPWKRRRITSMLCNRHGPPHHSDPARAVLKAKRNGGAVACWATRIPPSLPALAQDNGVPLWRIEDGFVRSAGLGASLVQPCSIVVDRKSVHYDPDQPSDLEDMLREQNFTPAELERADRLIALLNTSGVTKYNLQGKPADLPQDRPIVLVIGQVDDDQSVICGAAGMSSADLLHRVRAQAPDACIVYRPHPDVTATLRSGLACGPADIVEAHAPITQLIEAADAVHVMTSLTGFEALLRGKKVTTHGAPFYAGWGLTEDRLSFPRRDRVLTLTQLVAAVLVNYPIYAHPQTGKRCQIEELVEILAQQSKQGSMGLGRTVLAKAALGLGRLQNWGRT